MDIPYNWDFIQNNIPPEKLAELRKKFMEEWRSGKYTKKQMMERYRMSERTFRNMIKKYADAKELDDYKDKPRTPNNPHRKFTADEYNDVVKTFDDTRDEQNTRYSNFEEDMRAAGRNLSPPKLNAQKKKIWDVRPGVRKIKAIAEDLWTSMKKSKTIGKSSVHAILKKFGRYPEEEKEKVKPKEFQRPPKPGKCFCIDTGTCFIGDHTLSLKALEELCRLYPDKAFELRSDGGTEFDNNEVNDFFVKKDISWIKVSKPWDSPFAEMSSPSIV